MVDSIASRSAPVGGSRADRFARKLFRMLRSRTQRHNQHLWPFVRIWRNPAGVICGFRAFGRSVPITPLEQGYDPDDEMHLILSGPSIAEIPYDRLDIRAAMGVNGSIALARKFNLQFKYYCIIDQNFVRDRIDLVREIVACDLTLYVLPDVLRYIMQGIAQEEIRCRICIIEFISERAYQRSAAPAVLKRMVAASPDLRLLDAKQGLGYSFDASLGVFDADTVAYVALQVMISGGRAQGLSARPGPDTAARHALLRRRRDAAGQPVGAQLRPPDRALVPLRRAAVAWARRVGDQPVAGERAAAGGDRTAGLAHAA